MKAYLILLFSASLVGLSMPSKGQTPDKRLDSLFSSLNDFHLIHGNVLIAEKGVPVYKHSFGYRNIGKQLKNDDSTAFELASLSKVFTAVAVMQLYEERRLKLDDPVTKHISDFPFPEITIRQLLSHTSGLPDFQIFDSLYKQNPERIMTNRDIIPALKVFGKPALRPGEKWSYSSPGMGLLALIVERISKMSFQEYLSKKIFRPASMQHTYICSLAKPVNDNRRAIPYAFPAFFSSDLALADTMGPNQQFLHVSGGVEGPGLLVSTAEDLLRFDQALYSGKLVRQGSINEMFTPAKLSDGSYAIAPHYPGKALFGLGWFIMEDSSHGKIVFHSGYKPGTTTILLRNISKRQTVILLDNGNSPGLHISGVNAMRLLNKETPQVIKTPVTFTYGRDLIKKGPDYSLIHFQMLRKDTLHYTMTERDWIAMGYEFFRKGNTVQSLETFKIGHFLYPEHPFLCQLYADVLAKAGKKEEAIWMYNRALRSDPGNKEAARGLKAITEQ